MTLIQLCMLRAFSIDAIHVNSLVVEGQKTSFEVYRHPRSLGHTMTIVRRRTPQIAMLVLETILCQRAPQFSVACSSGCPGYNINAKSVIQGWALGSKGVKMQNEAEIRGDMPAYLSHSLQCILWVAICDCVKIIFAKLFWDKKG